MADLTDLEERLHAWLVESDFETVAWSVDFPRVPMLAVLPGPL